MKKYIVFMVLIVSLGMLSCEPSSDEQQRDQQEQILKEGTAETGMPAIHNFKERRLLKHILELRDQNNLLTYTYIFAENSGKLMFFCKSIGYGIPYATEYTNPSKIEMGGHVMPQADPNGLFSPSSAEGTWILCQNPHNTKETNVVYVEPRIVTSPFPLQ